MDWIFGSGHCVTRPLLPPPPWRTQPHCSTERVPVCLGHRQEVSSGLSQASSLSLKTAWKVLFFWHRLESIGKYPWLCGPPSGQEHCKGRVWESQKANFEVVEAEWGLLSKERCSKVFCSKWKNEKGKRHNRLAAGSEAEFKTVASRWRTHRNKDPEKSLHLQMKLQGSELKWGEIL